MRRCVVVQGCGADVVGEGPEGFEAFKGNAVALLQVAHDLLGTPFFLMRRISLINSEFLTLRFWATTGV